MFHNKFKRNRIINEDNEMLVGGGQREALLQLFYILSSFSTNIQIKIYHEKNHKNRIINKIN